MPLKYFTFTVGSFFIPYGFFSAYMFANTTGLLLWRSLLGFIFLHLLTLTAFLLVSFLVISTLKKLKLNSFYSFIFIICFFACYLFFWGIGAKLLPYFTIMSVCFSAVFLLFSKGRLSDLLVLCTLNTVLVLSFLFVDENVGKLKTLGIDSPTFFQMIGTRQQYVFPKNSGIKTPYFKIVFYASEENMEQVAQHKAMRKIITTTALLNSLAKKVVLSGENKVLLNKENIVIWISDELSTSKFIKIDNYSAYHQESFRFMIYDGSQVIGFFPMIRM